MTNASRNFSRPYFNIEIPKQKGASAQAPVDAVAERDNLAAAANGALPLAPSPSPSEPTSNISASCGKDDGALVAPVAVPVDDATNPADPPATAKAELTEGVAGVEPANDDKALADAYERCKGLRDETGQIIDSKWNKRAIKMLPFALAFVEQYSAEADGYQKLCALMKADGRHVPKEDKVKIELISVQICMTAAIKGGNISLATKRKADQTEWSRFANVVLVARHSNVKADDAAGWLARQTLNTILAEARLLKKGAAPSKPIPAVLKRYVRVATALAAGRGDQFDFVSSKLEAIDRELAAAEDGVQPATLASDNA